MMRSLLSRVLVALLVGFLVVAPAKAVLPPGPSSVTIVKPTVFGDLRAIFAKVCLPASYNSMLLTPQNFGLTGDLLALQFLDNATTNGFSLHFDPTTGFVTAFAAGAGSLGATFTGTPVTPSFTGTPSTLTGTIAAPTFTVKNGTIGSNMTLGLTADANSANLVGGTGITADRVLGASSPVGAPGLTMNSYTPAGTIGAITPSGTINVTGAGTTGPVSGGTDLSAECISVLAYGH